MDAAVVAILHGDLVLGVSRKDNPSLYGLIGGKAEDGESPDEAAKREALEETGLKINRMFYHYTNRCDGRRTVCYVTTHDNIENWDDLKPEPGCTLQWMTFPELIEKSAFPEYNKNTYELLKKDGWL